jgi:hypothetical protein
MFVTAQQLEQQMPDATRLLSDEPEMETSLHYMQLLLLVTSLELKGELVPRDFQEIISPILWSGLLACSR